MSATKIPEQQRKPLPFAANFVAGAIAGVSEILTFYPLDVVRDNRDVVKTRMQLQVGGAPVGLVGSFQQIIAQEGFGRLYRGLAAPLLLEAPKRAVKFAANDFWGKTYRGIAGTDKMTQPLSIATGCSAGATESFVVVPFELVKIKLQDKNSTFKGPMEVVKSIVRADGFLGLYAGMESTFWRHFWWNGGYFGSIFQVKAMLPKATTPGGELLNNFLSGSVGGFVGTVINTPFDVVKSRIQGAGKPAPGTIPKYGWTYPALVTIFREEGAGALYKGFLPKVLRLAPGGGVLLLVVEFTLGIFRQALGPPYI
ncbi:mitochondrial carrier [Auriculariales sp. MPI-PUGE-AT-0066]|nr:mitochondrial carrier [Auriculariales sp. MPI-PUGE-AT-0066]